MVCACHDLSEGGLVVALSEMCYGTNLGLEAFLNEVPARKTAKDHELLFSESPTRFLVEVEKEKKSEFEKAMKACNLGLIGCVSDKARLVIHSKADSCIIDLSVDEINKAWMKTFSEFR